MSIDFTVKNINFFSLGHFSHMCEDREAECGPSPINYSGNLTVSPTILNPLFTTSKQPIPYDFYLSAQILVERFSVFYAICTNVPDAFKLYFPGKKSNRPNAVTTGLINPSPGYF